MSQVGESDIHQPLVEHIPDGERQGAVEALFDILPPISEIFTFKGRINRTAFLLTQIFLILTLAAGLATFEGILSHGLQELLTISTPLVHRHAHPAIVGFFDRIGGDDPLRVVILGACVLAWYFLAFATTVRRFHDFGSSAGGAIVLNLVGLIPYIGALLQILPFALPGDPAPNEYGNPPEPVRFLTRIRLLPRHLWRGEVSLSNMLLVYVFFFDFVLLDKAGSTLMAGLDLSTINLLFVAALILLNYILMTGLWRSARVSTTSAVWRLIGRLVAIFMAARIVVTLVSLLIA
jgi:uncharacterized membrane protein YhaH (DUF805 family)